MSSKRIYAFSSRTSPRNIPRKVSSPLSYNSLFAKSQFTQKFSQSTIASKLRKNFSEKKLDESPPRTKPNTIPGANSRKSKPFHQEFTNISETDDLCMDRTLNKKELELLKSENLNLLALSELEALQEKCDKKDRKIRQAEQELQAVQLENCQENDNTKHFVETIAFMEKENEELKQMIRALEVDERQDNRLVGMINESDDLLVKLQKEYEAEKKRNVVLEKMHSDWKNIDKIRDERDRYKIKVTELISAIQKVSKGTISKYEYDQLNTQIQDMEAM